MALLRIYCDGSCLNNQGPNKVAACRIVVEGGPTITTQLGNTTNNLAEIHAILKSLEWAVEHKADNVEILSDSKCALAWINKGPSKSLPEDKAKEVGTLRKKIEDLKSQIKKVELRWIPGDEQLADFGNKGSSSKARIKIQLKEYQLLQEIAETTKKIQHMDLSLADKLRQLDEMTKEKKRK